MKYLALLLLVAAIGVQTRAPENLPKFEHGVRNIIEKLKHGDNNLPLMLPSLLPLKIQPTTTTYRAFTMNVSELTVQGLDHLQVDWVRASVPERALVDLAVSLAVSVPSTIVATADKYHLKGSILAIPIDAEGAFRAEINNLKAVAIVNLSRRGSGTIVADIHLDFSADVEVHLDRAGTLINKVVNSTLRDLLSDSDSVIFTNAKQVVTTMVNEYLRPYTPSQLIRIVEKEG
ncbi:hypothetical protein MSG28_014580 [Choristoneura fumiferana]|uniref:Uncharacterized protein n=1 Tax=Choristoneura fumiferana TaxID=7141 RepID=A0ACC0JSK5_CHOFU|nr:hypothetical protein MSG28_014580 [Choristoneura fumiferana]